MKHALKFAAFLLICLATEPSAAQDIKAIIENAPNQEAFWSITVLDEEGNTVESLNSEKLIIPASNQKLITSAAVLDHFGSDFRYETNIYGEGSQLDSTWNGNLIIKGSGDPAISGFFYDGDRYYVFKEFVRQLKAYGINRISGDLIADISLFDEQYYPAGWDWYDFSFYYGVQISPLSFNNNAVDLEVLADGEIGETPFINWFPDSTDYVHFINEQVISPSHLEYDEYYRRDFGNNEITLRSRLPQGYYETESLSIDNPPLFFLDSFAKYLNSQGIEFDGRLAVATRPRDLIQLPVLATHQSKPLAEIISWLNKESDNFYAEMLLKTLSAHSGTEPATFEHGVKQVKNFLASIYIDTTYVLMNDGSGLAGGNFTQTQIIAKVLYNMLSHAESEAFYKSMSVAGIDGSLAYRMKGTDLYKNFRGKTGYVSGVRTLSGYLRASTGKRLIVSIATNHFAGSKVQPVDLVHEQILQYLYDKY